MLFWIRYWAWEEERRWLAGISFQTRQTELLSINAHQSPQSSSIFSLHWYREGMGWSKWILSLSLPLLRVSHIHFQWRAREIYKLQLENNFKWSFWDLGWVVYFSLTTTTTCFTWKIKLGWNLIRMNGATCMDSIAGREWTFSPVQFTNSLNTLLPMILQMAKTKVHRARPKTHDSHAILRGQTLSLRVTINRPTSHLITSKWKWNWDADLCA